jgi:hypothetical protein
MRIEHLGETLEHEVRHDLVHAETSNLPSWATNAAEYFLAAEKYERAQGVILTEWKIDLPKALDRAQQIALVRDLVHVHLGDTHTVSWAMHEPTGLDGEPHPHAHICWSSRELDSIERSPEQFFKRYNASHPERGGARKTPELNQFGAARVERQTVTDLLNLHCERAGIATRYHPESLQDRGLDLTPEPKLLPSDSHKFHTRGIVTPRMQKVLDHRAGRIPHQAAEQANAAEYWQQRRQDLRLDHCQSPSQELKCIAGARHLQLNTKPPRQTTQALARKAQALTQSISSAELELATLRLEGTLARTEKTQGRAQAPPTTPRGEQRRTRGARSEAKDNRPLTPAERERWERLQAHKGRQAVHDLTGRLARLTARLAHSEEQAQAGSLPIRLHEKDREEDRGRGL